MLQLWYVLFQRILLVYTAVVCTVSEHPTGVTVVHTVSEEPTVVTVVHSFRGAYWCNSYTYCFRGAYWCYSGGLYCSEEHTGVMLQLQYILFQRSLLTLQWWYSLFQRSCVPCFTRLAWRRCRISSIVDCRSTGAGNSRCTECGSSASIANPCDLEEPGWIRMPAHA